MLSDATLAYGEEITAALLGVDALVREGGGDEDAGLIVLNMAPARDEPARYSGFDEAAARLLELRSLSGDLIEPDRRRYYDQLCASTLALLRWRQGQLSFQEQIGAFLHVPAAPVDESVLDSLRREMHGMLGSMGYDGSLSEQCAAWESRNRVPPDEIPGTLQSLLDESWDRTVERLEIPAPRSDGMRVTMVKGVPFNARCDYLHRSVELNSDPVLTYQSLKHLAVHECYPGHYVQFKLRETWYREGTATADGLLSIVNSASSSPFEGIADNGMNVIEWITTEDDRFAALMSRYRAAIGTGAAWRLHALRWPRERVVAWLADAALIGGDGWADNRIRFIAAPQRAALIWSYWWGLEAVEPVWRHQPVERRAGFLRYLYGRMHSPQTIGMYHAAQM